MRRTATLALALTVAVLLTGCQPPPLTKMRGTPDWEPVFASEEEALAAAEEAYRELVSLADLIFSEGGRDPERLTSVATGSFLESALEGFRQVQVDGWRSVGTTQIGSVQLQNYSFETRREEVVTIYVCEDISDVDVLDASGASVVAPGRPDTTTFQVVLSAQQGSGLLVSSREAWSNEPC